MRTRDMLRLSFAGLNHTERSRVLAMYGSILALHLIGFVILVAFVIPAHYRGLGIGVSVLAYTLGLRHAFDADHISAIDNTTRKSLHDRKGTDLRALSPSATSSHSATRRSSMAIGVGIIIAERTVYGAVSNSHSDLEQFGGVFGTVVSASLCT